MAEPTPAIVTPARAETNADGMLAVAVDVRVLVGKIRRRFREQSNTSDNLTPSQTAVLSRLATDGPMTVSALARAEGVRPQSMGANVSVLLAAGHVVGTPDPKDGRQTILSLTDAFLKEINAGRTAREDWLLRAIRSSLTPEEQQQLATGVELLKRVVEQ